MTTADYEKPPPEGYAPQHPSQYPPQYPPQHPPQYPPQQQQAAAAYYPPQQPTAPVVVPAQHDTPPPPANSPPTVNTASKNVRAGFLTKVYVLLTINFLITIGISLAFALVRPIRNWIEDNWWVTFVGLGVAFAALLVLACVRISFPTNLILMYVFVLGFSVMVGAIVATFYSRGSGVIVLQAFIATAAVFLSVTAMIAIFKIDFSFLGYFLGAGLIVLIVLSLINWLIDWPRTKQGRGFSFAISVLGALLMTGYLLYDTSKVLLKYGPDQWLVAVISLYTDVTNLFLYLLTIFSFVGN